MAKVVSLAQIEGALAGIDVVAIMERAFVGYSRGEVMVPPVVNL